MEELTIMDIGDAGAAYPQILALSIDTSASMNGQRISAISKYIESQIPKSQQVVLYTMDTTCFKLTKCLTNKEFIKQSIKNT